MTYRNLQRARYVLTDSVNVAEPGGDGEVGGDGTERRLDGPDVLRLGVERSVVDSRIVNTILCYQDMCQSLFRFLSVTENNKLGTYLHRL